jgi:N-acyl-D-amino-acid deacylase
MSGTDEWDSYFDILQAAGGGMKDLTLVGELFTDDHLAEQMAQPLFSFGVDAYTSSAAPDLSSLPASPLSFRGHVHYLSHHVRERRTVTLEEAVRRMTSMPANRFAIKDRGSIRQGCFADAVVLDPATVDSQSTFAEPRIYPTGIDTVIVNGSIVIDSGVHTGTRAGRVLRRS